jgi:hypothetical protein
VAIDYAGGKQLVAYVVPASNAQLSCACLTQHAAAKLPAYMMPAQFVILDQLPLTANGKVDRRALPAPASENPLDGERIPPRTEAEKKVAAVWQEVLGRNSFDVRQDFFKTGGHSLLATQVASRLSEVFGVEVPVVAVFEHPTIETLAGIAPLQGHGREKTRIRKHLPVGQARELLDRLEDLSDAEVERLLAEFEDSVK